MVLLISIFGRKRKTFKFENSFLSVGDFGGLEVTGFANTKGHWMPKCVPRPCPKHLGPGDTVIKS